VELNRKRKCYISGARLDIGILNEESKSWEYCGILLHDSGESATVAIMLVFSWNRWRSDGKVDNEC
jgi:hypothetical protein